MYQYDAPPYPPPIRNITAKLAANSQNRKLGGTCARGHTAHSSLRSHAPAPESLAGEISAPCTVRRAEVMTVQLDLEAILRPRPTSP